MSGYKPRQTPDYYSPMILSFVREGHSTIAGFWATYAAHLAFEQHPELRAACQTM